MHGTRPLSPPNPTCVGARGVALAHQQNHTPPASQPGRQHKLHTHTQYTQQQTRPLTTVPTAAAAQPMHACCCFLPPPPHPSLAGVCCSQSLLPRQQCQALRQVIQQAMPPAAAHTHRQHSKQPPPAAAQTHTQGHVLCTPSQLHATGGWSHKAHVMHAGCSPQGGFVRTPTPPWGQRHSPPLGPAPLGDSPHTFPSFFGWVFFQTGIGTLEGTVYRNRQGNIICRQ